MGWFEGGMFMTMIYFTVLLFFIMSGVASQINPALANKVQCLPNQGNIGQYGDLNSSQIGVDCVDTNSSSVNVSTSFNERPGVLSFLSQSIVGFDFPGAISSVIQFLAIFAVGWVVILEVILGTAGGFSFLILPIGGILQIFQLLFFVDIGNKLIAIFRGGSI